MRFQEDMSRRFKKNSKGRTNSPMFLCLAQLAIRSTKLLAQLAIRSTKLLVQLAIRSTKLLVQLAMRSTKLLVQLAIKSTKLDMTRVFHARPDRRFSAKVQPRKKKVHTKNQDFEVILVVKAM